PLSAYPKEYSLEDLYVIALEKNETIKIAEEDLYISKRGKDKAIAVFFPTLSAYGTHTRYSEEKQVATVTLQPNAVNTWGLRADQSFSLSGREIAAYKIASKMISKSAYDLDAAKEEYLLSVASAYYDVMKAVKTADIAKSNVDRLTKHRDAANTRLRVGEATKTTLLRAEAELAGAQSEMIRAENNLKLTKTVLARVAGISEDFEVKESQEQGVRGQELEHLIINCQLPPIDCLKEIASNERTELKALVIGKNIAEHEVTYARGSFLPTLSLEGVYSKKDTDPSSSYDLESIYGGVKLNFPFFEGGLRRAEVLEAKAKLRQAEYNLSNLKNSINVNIANAYLNLITEMGILEKLKAEAEYARDNYNAVSKQFEYGLANNIEVMDANTLLVSSERQLVNAEYDYQFAVLKLKRTTGTLLKTVERSQVSGVRGQGSGENK
ncbi:MAG: TolC family protein, partial [Nitrospirota bacterium]